MRVAVIGSGASGLMASLFASKSNDVVVFDGNSDAGKKLLLTGNGRCNIGNVNNDLSKYHSSNDELIKQVISEQNINIIKNVFENIGLVIKNKNGYLYPYSEKSSSVLSVLKSACINNNVKFKFNSIIDKIEKLNERDKKIMILRYGLFGNEEVTQKDVADMLGISQSYISRIEKKVIKRLKNIVKV